MFNDDQKGRSRLAGRVAAAGLLAAVVGAGFAPTASEASAVSTHSHTVKPATTGYHHIRNAFFSSQCVDAPGGVHNVVLRITKCDSGSDTQDWAMTIGPGNTMEFVNHHSGDCMEVNHGSNIPGELVDEFDCKAGGGGVLWVQPPSSLNLQHAGTGLCLDTVGGAGSQLAQFPCGTGMPAGTQLWFIE